MASQNPQPTYTYAPFRSSPLNPHCEAAPTPARRRRSRTSRKFISVSPSQRLLRQKAAEAWRSQVTSRRVAEYQSRAIQAISQRKKDMGFETVSPLRPVHPPPPKGLRTPVVNTSSKGDEEQPYMFQMPDLGFFTPRKVVLAVGMMRALPSLKTQESAMHELKTRPVPQLMC